MIAKQFWKAMSLLMVVSLLAAACTQATAVPQPTAVPAQPTAAPAQPTAAPKALKIGLVSDQGGVNDKSFNQGAWEGVQKASKEFGFEAQYVESKQPTDYEKNIDQFATEGYGVIVTVGFMMGDATAAKAKQYPNIKFAIVDNAYFPTKGSAACADTVKDCYADGGLTNVTSLMFQEDEVGFLAGVVAAGMSKTGTICTVSGMEIPPVVRYVTGYQAGAKWLKPDIEALNVYIPSFIDPAKGKENGQAMIGQGCDVLFGVGGNTGNGGLLAAKEKGLMAIGVDVDQYNTYPEVKDALVTSAQKNVDAAVYSFLKTVKDGSVKPGVNTANLKNGGVGLAPYHDWDSKVPAEVKAKVQEAIDGLKAGTLSTTPAAAPAATVAPADQPTAVPQAFTIPDIQQGKFNVAVVLVGFHADGGWSQAHTEGAQWMSTQDPTIAVSYIDVVVPGPDAESVMRSLARKGFDLIIGTTFEYGPTMDTLAEEFPKVSWLHVSGYRSNGTNYGNLFGAMEDMKYLAGMVAGARAKADNNTKLGYVAPWPLPEVIRLGNAFMLGAKITCPECTMEVRWINTWYDPDKEKQAAQSLLDAGVDIVLIGSDTPGPLVAAANGGKWAFTYDYINSCQPASDKCLGTPYWNWGPVYLNVVKQIRAGTWKPGNDYLDADSGIVGFYGFMPGQTPQPGVPKDVVAQVQAKLADMVAGKFTRKDVFKGPIKDNTGKVVVPAGQSLTDEDLQGIDAATIKSGNLSGRTACTICMNWLADGIQGTIPAMP